MFVLPKTVEKEKMADRVLYWGSGSVPAWRALIALTEKGLEFESKLVEFSKGEHKGPDIMAINPRGQVPSFKDGDAIVNESLAILQYLEDAYPEPALLPKDKALRAKTIQRMHEAANAVLKVMGAVYIKMRDGPEEEFKTKLEDAKKELAYWEEYLKDAEFLVGSQFTLADVAFAPSAISLIRFGASLNDYPNIKKYAEKMKEWPSIAATTPPHWKDTEGKGFLTGAL